MKNIFKNELFNNFANFCLDNGLTIIVPENTDYWSFLTFTDGTNFGYAQLNNFKYAICFYTVHKGNKNCGTGFGLDDSYEGVEVPTMEDIKRAFVFAPNWAKSVDVAAVKKYTSLEDYFSVPINNISQKTVITPNS